MDMIMNDFNNSVKTENSGNFFYVVRMFLATFLAGEKMVRRNALLILNIIFHIFYSITLFCLKVIFLFSIYVVG